MLDAPLPISPAMQVTACDAVRQLKSHPSGYRDAVRSSWTSIEPPKSRIAVYALQALEKARAADEETHKGNLVALAHNRALVEHISATMKAAGIPDTWSKLEQTRARYPKRTTQPAGYLGDLARFVITDDNWTAAMMRADQLMETYTVYKAEADSEQTRAAQAKEDAAERARASRRANIKLATIILRYDLGADDDWPEVLAALCKRDQRVDLAVAMQLTRLDWSEGFHRVADALNRFTIQTDEDKEIATDVVSCMQDDDGRVFRDTRWSYDALFASVQDRQLVEDVQTVLSNIGDVA